ncbi:hypothetical protein [Spiroplasma endosymbiont of Stenodema calcarata]|uniref:hypothetical protein n=1 Tax=Spiroplasma endosymbiont of Stenodema calcarata TaxID=3139328 RepID=UPI003CCAAAB1
MQNNIRYIYDEMCDACKKTFKKIILAIRNDRTKDVNNLALFFCEINPTSSIEDDRGVMPIALINCVDNKYAFFWKTNLLDRKGSPKIPIIGHTIELSQETIDKIPSRRRPSTTILPGERASFANEKPVSVSLPVSASNESTVSSPLVPFIKPDNKLEESLSTENETIPPTSDNSNDKERNDIVVVTKPVVGETTTLVNQMQQKNQVVALKKKAQVVNQKVQWKIWSLIVVLAIALTGFGIGGWQLYRYLNKGGTNDNGGEVVPRTNITLLGGDLSRQVITIENKNDNADLHRALLTLEVGSKNKGKLEPQLLEAIKDPHTIITFNSDRFKEDQTAYAATIIINADKATNFYGITNIAVQAKSKRIDINQLSKDLRGTEVAINNNSASEILRAVLANNTITNQLSANQKRVLNDAKNLANHLTSRVEATVKQGDPATNVDLIIISNGSDLYKNIATFNLNVKWS